MVRKIIILIGFCTFFCLETKAHFVSPDVARLVAQNFFKYMTKSTQTGTMDILPIEKGKDTLIYAVSLTNKWVLIAGDKRVQPILAYSDDNSEIFPSRENIPPVLADAVEWYAKQIDHLDNDTITRMEDFRWDLYLLGNENDLRALNTVIVSPLLNRNGHHVAWNQYGRSGNPNDSIRCYNKFCPASTSCINGHMVTGCVPVALGQIMWYWQWPYAHMEGSTNYHLHDWDLIPNEIVYNTDIEEADEIAILLHDIGVVAGTSYGCASSSTSNDNIVSTLNTFSYTSSNILNRSNYAESTWINMIKSNLNNLQPVFYSGFNSSSSGHAFVIDGYNSDNMFHINYGDGFYDANFSLLDNTGYPNDQLMVKDIQPTYPSCSPVTIPSTDIWNTNFLIQRRGGITIGNRTITNGMNGVIASGDYVLLTNGFKVNSGAKVYITCCDIQCDNRTDSPNAIEYPNPIHEQRKHDNANHLPSASKIFRNGQILILRDGKTYTITGNEVR